MNRMTVDLLCLYTRGNPKNASQFPYCCRIATEYFPKSIKDTATEPRGNTINCADMLTCARVLRISYAAPYDSCVVHACRTLALNVHQLLDGYQVPYTRSSVCCEGTVMIASMHSAVGHHQIIHHSMSTCLRPKPLFALPRPNDVTGSRSEPGRHRPGTRCRVSTSAVRYKPLVRPLNILTVQKLDLAEICIL